MTSDRPTHYQALSPEAEAEVRKALEPIPVYQTGFNLQPIASESYECDNCPASFGYQPEDFRCPLCKGQLGGQVTIEFYPPCPEDGEA